MLRIREVCKTYRTGELVQQALDHVSLTLRENEFVAVLGPSGSGKTTLLNIIGGLDQYDSGDLIIDGTSTRRYNSRDWDAYRNHTIGFVFQSYNLIPHQTILKNVELALTISGVGRAERTRRAREALEKVGLGEQTHKKPNQLSGGQMQRVAIARALVNDPKILLADEPTGALDSETSLQVMDLLREVARDRLVVMVTHNPDLARQYATRIVTLKDGVITSDSHPVPEEETPGEQVVHRRLGRASMSFLTALSLSFNNLWSKKGRTILVAVAGSIGIIGIAMILSLSRGVNDYVDSVEQETLQDYPLTLSSSMVDLSSLLEAGEEERLSPEDLPADAALERPTATSLISQVNNNDLASLKTWLESDPAPVAPYAQATDYLYNLSPHIYRWENGTYRKVNPDDTLSAMGLGISSSSVLSGSMTRVDSFHPMPSDPAFYQAAYEVKAGRWPARWDECVVVLTRGQEITDMTLYTLGLKDPAILQRMLEAFSAGENVEQEEEDSSRTYPFSDILGQEFRLVHPSDYYSYNEEYGTWTDRTEDEDYMKALVRAGEPLSIVGIVVPQRGMSTPLLEYGIGYLPELTDHLIERAAGSDIVRAQLAHPETDVFSGAAFGSQDANPRQLDLASLISVDQDQLKKLFEVDPSHLTLDPSQLDLSGLELSGADLTRALDLSDASLPVPSLTSQDVANLLSGVKVQVSAQSLRELFSTLMGNFLRYSAQDPATDYQSLPDAFRAYWSSPAARELLSGEVGRILQESLERLLTPQQLQEMITSIMSGYPDYIEKNKLDFADPPTTLVGYLSSPEARELLADSAAALRGQIREAAITPQEAEAISRALMESYETYARENDLPDPSRLVESFSAYLSTPAARQLLSDSVAGAVDTSDLEGQAARMLSGYSALLGSRLSDMAGKLVSALSDSLRETLTASMSALAAQLGENLTSLFSVDPKSLAAAFRMNMDTKELSRLVSSLVARNESSLGNNLSALGWADTDDPFRIVIYPKDFDSKTRIKDLLAEYNRQAEAAGEPDKVIRYNDMVGTLTASISQIVNSISMVLIAFVGISLVVSSVMIGIITYISVLERKKEIGILRAIGASKRNISAVFNAETVIIGGLAGLFGVVFTVLLLFPTNSLIRQLSPDAIITAYLPPEAAVILILLSIGLTLLGGLIPSRKAAKSDPVEALRSD